MQIRKAERRKAKIKLAIQGPAGSGKTMSSLLLAQGLVGDLTKVCVIDTENSSADLYAHLGEFKVITLEGPFTPEKYIKAIDACVEAGIECIIIDSISHCWDYLLEYHSSLQGNSFTNWAKVTPRQRAFVEKMLWAPVHVVATMRVKQDYVLNQKDGKYVPEKVGLKAVQRDGVDYEFTILFELDNSHHCKCTKDRTGIFSINPEFIINIQTGIEILKWCNQGISLTTVREKILKCNTLEELSQVYKEYSSYYEPLKAVFQQQKKELNQLSILNTQENGSHTQQ